MTTLVNSFEESTNGTTLTTSNANNAIDNSFDVVTAGGTVKFSGLHQAHGSMSLLVSTTTAAVSSFGWTTSLGTQSAIFGRAYVYPTAVASTADTIVRFQSGASLGGGIRYDTAGKISIVNAAGTVTQTSASALTLNQWARIEWALVCGSAGSASLTVSIYRAAAYDTIVITQTLTDSTSAFGVTGSINEVLFGWCTSNASQPELYFDDVGVSTNSYFGPVFTADTYPPFPANPLGVVVAIFIGQAWADITHLCRSSADIQISSRGKPDETQDINSATVTMTLNNSNGIFSPNNANSPFYPWIQTNTLLSIYVASQSANGTVYTGYRFMGDVRKWPPSWDPTGNDNWVNITAHGVVTRYIQGGNVGSTLRRYFGLKLKQGWTGGSSATTSAPLYPIAYWPCEELTGASSFQNLIPSGSTMTWTGTPQLSSDSSMPGSDPLPLINGSTWTGSTNSYSVQGPIAWTKPGLYPWVCPGGVTSLSTVNVVAGGGGGSNGVIRVAGAGGEEAIDTNVAVTPGNSYAVYVGKGGNGGRATETAIPHLIQQFSSYFGTFGQNSYFQGDSVTTKAHGGGAAQPSWISSLGGVNPANDLTRGGTGSTSASHFDGGKGGIGALNGGGGGGGGSGGSAASGNNGANASGKTGGAGGSAVTGGGPGGAGETFQEPGVFTHGLPWEYVIRAPVPGGSPGGGGGSGSNGNTYGPKFGPGCPGGPGSVTINFASATVPQNVVIRFAVNVPSGGMPDGAVLLRATVGSGTLAKVEAYYNAANQGIGFRGYNSVPTLLFDTGTTGTEILAGGGSVMCSLEMSTTGSTVFCALDFRKPTDTGLASWPFTSFTGTIGTISQIIVNPNGTVQDVALGQIVLQYAYEALFNLTTYLNSHAGELAVDRFKRICEEEQVIGVVQGDGYWSWDSLSAYQNSYTPIQLQSWNSATCLLTPYPDWQSFGNNSLLVCNSSSGTNAVVSSPQLPVNAGQYVSAYADVNTLGKACQFRLSIKWIDITGAVLSTVTGSTFTAAAPFNVQTVSITQVLAPANATSFFISLTNLTAPSVAGEQFAIDNVCAAIGVLMGSQPDESMLDILQQVEDADRGLIIEPRDYYGLRYRSRGNLINSCMLQQPAVIIDYSQAQLAQSLQPVSDEQLLHNSITVTRINGGSVNAQLQTGQLSVQLPPSGAGIYPYTPSVNVYVDTQLAALVAWLLIIGTIADFRYTSIVIDLTRSAVQSLFGQVPAIDGGDHVQIINGPPQLPSPTIDQLALAFDENINTFKWLISYTGAPESPYNPNLDTSGEFWNTGSVGSWVATGGALTIASGLNAPLGYYLQLVTASNGQFIHGVPITVLPNTNYTVFWAIQGTATNQIQLGLLNISGAVTVTLSGTDWAFGSAEMNSGATISTYLLAKPITAAPVTFQLAYFLLIPTSEVLSW